MVGKTAAERKAIERARKALGGLERYEMWLTPVEWIKVRNYTRRYVLSKRKPVNQ